MQISTSKAGLQRSRGFSLLELLLVLLLLGLLAGAALTLDFNGSPQRTEALAQEFAVAMQHATQEAILGGAALGLDFFTVVPTRNSSAAWGYRWLILQDSAWQPLPERMMPEVAHEVFAADIQATLQVEGKKRAFENQVTLTGDEPDFVPEVLLWPTREVTPFVLSVRPAAADARVPALRVSVDLLGRVQVLDNDDAR